MGRTNNNPWTFLEEELLKRLPNHYNAIRKGDEELFRKATTKEAREANRPILTVRNKKNNQCYNIIAINQAQNTYSIGERIKLLVDDYARKGEHSIILPLAGEHNKITPIEQSRRYRSGDHEFTKAFSRAGREGRKHLYEVNGIEFANRIPITKDQSIVQRVGKDQSIEHYIARLFIDADGDERGDVLDLNQFSMADEGYKHFYKKLVGPGMVELLVDRTDYARPGLLVPSNESAWGSFLKEVIAPTYHK